MQKKPYQGQIKIGELESIRGLAALLIIFFHTTATNPLIDIGIINNGYLMVELFFVLSGFIIFNSYANEINSSKELIRFQFLRLGRIYPLHLLFLLIFLTLETIRYILGTKLGMLNSRALPFDKNNLDAFIQHVFLIQAIGPTGNALTFNGPAWSISVEFYTYLIFGVTILLLKHMQTYIFGLIAIITLFMLVADFTYGFNDLLRCLSGFFIGCLTAISIKNIRKTIPSYLSLLTFTSILIFLQLKTTNDFDNDMSSDSDASEDLSDVES